VFSVTGTEVSLKSSTFNAGPVVPIKRPGLRTFTVLPIFAPQFVTPLARGETASDFSLPLLLL